MIRDVDLDTARNERARLNAEAGIVVGRTMGGPTQYNGMYMGERVTYEIRSKSGMVI